MSAIKINVTKPNGTYDPGVSKFFGSPTIPHEWEDEFSDDVIFFCQLRLSDIAKLDKQNLLPHTGYLYVFLDVEMYPYTPMVYYYDGEPDMVLDDFNEAEPGFEHLNQDFLMSFELDDDDVCGNKLFGNPGTDCCTENRLFMQFDPLEGDMGFLSETDGYMCLFFADDPSDLENISIFID